MGYGEAKKELLGLIWEYFKPFREKREALEKDPGEVMNILKKGADKAREVASKTLDDVKSATGLKYN